MAVFTALSREDIEGLLSHYQLGALQAFEGIPSGIENTNYFVDTADERAGDQAGGRWVLTVFERLNFQQLPYYLELMRHLARRGLPVPLPQENRSGALVSEARGKPAAFVTRVNGRWLEKPDAPHCASIGALLARMHLEARDFEPFQPNLRGIGWWKSTLPKLEPFLDDSTFHVLAEEVILQDGFFRDPAFEKLPQGAVHADLFRDNVLWERLGEPGERIGGVIDFYFAGNTLWLFDLAVTVNDWCVDPEDGTLDHARAQALLDAYHAVRPLTELEGRAWRTVLRGAALRFWMSRLFDVHLPRDAHTLKPHDPRRFELTLRHRIADDRLPWVAT